MSLDLDALRRRAAVAVFGELLDEPALLAALRQQDATMRNDSVTEIIAFVDRVAAANGFDPAGCKKLYTAFFAALRQPVDSLPPDPLAALRPARPARASPPDFAQAPVAAPPVAAAPLVVQPAVATPASAPVVTQAVPPAEAADDAPLTAPAADVAAPSVLPGEPPVVFSMLVRTVLAELHAYHREALDEVGRDAVQELDRSDVSPPLKHHFRHAWRRPLAHDWRLDGMSLELAELVRVLFVALTQAFGRNGADQILGRAVQAAERLPEARRYSPKRLLSAM